MEILKLQVKALKETAERLEKRNQELKIKGETARLKELNYYRTLGEQLKVGLAITSQYGSLSLWAPSGCCAPAFVCSGMGGGVLQKAISGGTTLRVIVRAGSLVH